MHGVYIEPRRGQANVYSHCVACCVDQGCLNHESCIDIGAGRQLTKEEKNLLELLAAFPDMVYQAAENYKPSILANHIFDCAKAFNEFYHACPVLQADPPLKKARLALVLATRKILRTGLNIMGIEAPERM